MAQSDLAEELTLSTSIGDFGLHEVVRYPNGGSSSFYEYGSIAIIVDDGICDCPDGQAVFDYSQITSKQNEYVARNERVYRFLREDLDEVEVFLDSEEEAGEALSRRAADRANAIDPSPLELAFEEHFCNVYGSDGARFLQREYAVVDLEGSQRFLDYAVRTESGVLAVEENGVSYHHPQIIGKDRYRSQLLKQNSCEHEGIKLFRFSSEDCRFAERFEDDIRSYFGSTADGFIDAGIVASRSVGLYEHQEGALEEMELRRAKGDKCFLAVFPTASGKSRIVEEDLARFAPTRAGFKGLIMAPSRQIVSDWKERLGESLPQYAEDILVCTYAYINRHYLDYAPEHFDYIVVDEAHHAVAPALKRTIQHFDPGFLVGLTATDQRPDKKGLEAVFGAYRVGLSLPEAMEKGIVATANVYRIETNIDLSKVRINGKDYVNADLERTIRVGSRNELVADVICEYFTEGEAAKRQGVVFCVNVRHAEEMARLLNEAGIPAKALSGAGSCKTKPEEIMEEFGRKEIRFLCSCQMINEGWDYPELGILVMARPTLSRVLYLQQIGRGLRKTSTKSNVIVVDVVDEYAAAVVPCSMHTIFQNPCYVPFGDITRRDYKPGEWIEVDGIHERVERIVEIDTLSFAERHEGYLSVEQLAREFFVSTDTVGGWIKKGRIEPTVSFSFGSKSVHMFSPEDAEAVRERMGIPVHDDETIRDDFFDFLEERDYSLSYKMVFLTSFIDHMDPATGGVSIEDVLKDYIAFYRSRIDRGLPVDRRTCPYNEKTLEDRKFIKRNMLANPFEKFERKRFLYYSKDLGIISMNHALQSRLGASDLEVIREQMQEDLGDYYAKL